MFLFLLPLSFGNSLPYTILFFHISFQSLPHIFEFFTCLLLYHIFVSFLYLFLLFPLFHYFARGLLNTFNRSILSNIIADNFFGFSVHQSHDVNWSFLSLNENNSSISIISTLPLLLSFSAIILARLRIQFKHVFLLIFSIRPTVFPLFPSIYSSIARSTISFPHNLHL